jgi:hypothetical protein
MTDFYHSIQWLVKSSKDPRRIHLLGNHDVAYFYPGKYTYCSGWNPLRQRLFDEAFGVAGPESIRNCLHLAVSVGPWLLSHAGFSGNNLRDVGKAELLGWAEHAKSSLARHEVHPLTGCGRIRGGFADQGGIFWLDWNHEFTPLDGIHQLVGHTVDRVIRGHHLAERGNSISGPLVKTEVRQADYTSADCLRSVNWCLDAGQSAWAIIHEDHIELHDSTGVTTLPNPASVSAELHELLNLGLLPVTDARPPAFVPWSEIARRLGTPEKLAAFQITIRPETQRTEGPTPSETARSLRALLRKGFKL